MPLSQPLSQRCSNSQIVHRTVLSNGITLLGIENPAADIVSARFFLRGGSACESAQQAGLAQLVAAVITKGAAQYTSRDIADRVESIGASLSADAAADYFLLSLKAVSADFVDLLTLAADLLRFPTFPTAEVDLERRLMLQAIAAQQEQPFTLAFEGLCQAMYGTHPYARSGMGKAETVAPLTPEDFRTYHQTYFRPDNLVISIVGRMTAVRMVALVEQILGDWPRPLSPLPRLNLPQVLPTSVQVTMAQETQQSIVMVGAVAPSVLPPALHPPALGDSQRVNPDYAALKLLNTYLGNGLSSRLFVELREKQGLAYEVSAFYPTRLAASHFVAYLGTAPDNTAIAIAALQAELDRLQESPLSSEALQIAKNKLLGQYALGKQTNSQLAQTFGWYETLGLGLEFDDHFPAAIAAVTAVEAQQAARQYLAHRVVSVLGPAAIVEKMASSEDTKCRMESEGKAS